MPKASKERTTKSRVKPSQRDASQKRQKPINNSSGAENTQSEKPKSAPPESYLLLVRLRGTCDPMIQRLLSVPIYFNFVQLHNVLQIAMGWAGIHAFKFEVSKLLEEGDEPNWMTGRGEDILQLYINDSIKDCLPDPDIIKKMSDYTLKDIYEREEYKGKVELSYEYDHGDGWDNDIVFLQKVEPSMRKALRVPDSMAVFCLSGEGHPCAEDAGGAGGWEDLKTEFKKKGDKDGTKSWYKTSCANGDPKGLDPYNWSILDVNDGLAKIETSDA